MGAEISVLGYAFPGDPGLVQHAAHHRLERAHRTVRIGGVERNLVVFRAEVDRELLPRRVFELLARIGIESQVARIEISLKEPVMLQQIVVVGGDEGTQDRTCDLAMIHRTQRFPEIMEQGDDDQLFARAVAQRPRGGLQTVAAAVEVVGLVARKVIDHSH